MSIFVGSRHRAAESGIMSVLSSHKPHAAGVLPVMQAPPRGDSGAWDRGRCRRAEGPAFLFFENLSGNVFFSPQVDRKRHMD